MTDEERAPIRERAEKATPGPWERGTQWGARESLVYEKGSLLDTIGTTKPPVFFGQVSNMPNFREDAEFIAHAREDIPALLGDNARLEAENAALREIAQAVASAGLYVMSEQHQYLIVKPDANGKALRATARALLAKDSESPRTSTD